VKIICLNHAENGDDNNTSDEHLQNSKTSRDSYLDLKQLIFLSKYLNSPLRQAYVWESKPSTDPLEKQCKTGKELINTGTSALSAYKSGNFKSSDQ
jgi:hypothetical protein